MENTKDITTLTDLELMKVFLDVNSQTQNLKSQYLIIINEFNHRSSTAEKLKSDAEKQTPKE